MKRYKYNYGKNPEGALSTISGYATETTNFGETAFGILNKSTRDEENFTTPEVVSSSTATLFSVGNGTDHDSRKNIIELKADGTVYINGVGQYDGTNPGEATDIADEFQGIHDDITGLNEDVDRIDNTIESIHISEDNANLVYTLLVDGQERGTINIPRDQFLKNVSYNDETNNLEFTFIVRGENNEEVEKQVNVNMTDLEDIYSAGDGLNLENKQFSVKVDADTQPYIEVSSNGVKIIGINEALDKKVSWDESKKVITLPADGSISALRNNGLEGGVLVCQRTYDDGATYVTEVGTTKNNLTLNSIERPKIDFADGTSQNIAYQSEVKSLQDRMSTAETDIDNLEDRIDTAEGDIDTIQSDLSDLMGDGEGSVQDQIKTALEDYLPLSGGTLTGNVEMENAGLTINHGDLIVQDGLNGQISMYPNAGMISLIAGSVSNAMRIQKDISLQQGGNYPIAIDYSSEHPCIRINQKANGTFDLSLAKDGVTVKDKTETDLLNAAGGTTSISDIIAKVPQPDLSSYATKEEVGSNIYTDSNYLSKETNLTDAVLQLDEEIKATNDNLDLEHANAEATYAKKTDLSGYLPKQTPMAMAALYVSGAVSGVSPTPAYSMLDANGIKLLDENYESRGSDAELFNTNGGTVSISDITSQVDLSNYATKSELGAYAQKTELGNYLPLTGGTISGYIYFSDTQNLYIGGNRLQFTNSQATIIVGHTGSRTAIKYSYGGNKSAYIGTGKVDGSSGDQPNFIVSSGDYNRTVYGLGGVSIHGKSTSDLLNAGGSTTSISDLVSQVTAAIVDGAPTTLDTLNELAAALGDDPNFATTVTNQIAQKADKTTATTSTDGLMSAADKAKLDSITIQDGDIVANGFRINNGTANEVLTADGDSNILKTINGQTLLGSGDVDMSEFALKTELEGYLPLTGGTITDDLYTQGMTNPDDNGEYYVGITKSGFVITKTSNKSTRIIELGRNSASSGGLGYLDFYNSYGNINLRINPNGITLIDKTANDLLNGAGGTTTLKTINGESLLGSGDITTPTPTVNAASGTKTIWTGTQSEYEAVATKDANTLYFITED